TNAVFDGKDKTFRPLPIEITFTGSEASLRSFLSSLDDSKKYYYVIRTMKVANVTQKAPTATDANFTKAAEETSGVPASSGADGFVLPDDPSAAPAATPATPAAAVGSDTGKILQQVLGSEKIQVFLRIDILQFLAARELPKA
ncbi:MAG: hypothetical protein JWO82_268, partial [Akkermansiaceae bacterium]|nr:hypothetical protein [Akkermansiaceae bacterium]